MSSRATGYVEMSPKGRQKAWNDGESWPKKIDEPSQEPKEMQLFIGDFVNAGFI